MAAEAIVSVVLEQLTTLAFEKIRKGVGLVAGAGKAVENLKSNLESIQALLEDAEKKQVIDKRVRVWLEKLKEASYDVDDVLGEWNTKNLKLQQTDRGVVNASLALKKKVCRFFLSPGYCFRRAIFGCEIAFKIKEINERLDAIAREKTMFDLNVVNRESINKRPERVTSSYVDVSDICGRDEEKQILISKLLSESDQDRKGLHIISLVGMGGIGKTTLAQYVYNNQKVVNNFDKRIWVCVSDPFDQFRVAKAILVALGGDASKLDELQALLDSISDLVKEKKIFLVLDDVWEEDYKKWESLCNCLKNSFLKSKILVTTRKEKVAQMMESTDIVPVKNLREDECWSLFTRLAFVNKSIGECEKLEEVGRSIVGKCMGLPLAIKSIGGLLRFKKTSEEWDRILKSEMWNLEVFKKDVFPALLLSYNDLPYIIKRCFSYCAIFPKDHDMKKDQLVQLWMAQGYLGLDDNEEMEVIGGEYFDDLAVRSFFQDFEKDDHGDIIGCKMHDIVHDFAQSLTIDECLALESSSSKEPIGACTSLYAKARHSTVTLGFDVASFPVSILNAKKLRSLLIYGWFCEDFKLYDKLKCLRALGFIDNWGVERISRKIENLIHLRYLNLSGCGRLRELPETLCELYHLQTLHIRLCSVLEKLPQRIGNLIHLRYLNLSHCDSLRELPETLCELYNLQTLDISFCSGLEKLPQGMGKLINLRHLLNDGTRSLEYMPKGIDRLTGLRTLKEFVVGGGSEGSPLECLKNLRSLRGSLRIRRLGNVKNVDEVKKAQVLENKEHLIDLSLDFGRNVDESGDERMERIGDEQVLESLQPPSNLEKLSIYHYGGNSSTWLSICKMESLTKLRDLTLSVCHNFDRLPPLGKLTYLESLRIEWMRNVKRVGNEFLGISEDNNNNNNNIGTSSSSFIAFPKLKYLTFRGMYEWEEWDIANEYIFMPSLLSLTIEHCWELKELPHHLFEITKLEKLQLVGCRIIEERCKGDYWPMIAHIPTIVIDFNYVKRDGVQIQQGHQTALAMGDTTPSAVAD